MTANGPAAGRKYVGYFPHDGYSFRVEVDDPTTIAETMREKADRRHPKHAPHAIVRYGAYTALKQADCAIPMTMAAFDGDDTAFRAHALAGMFRHM